MKNNFPYNKTTSPQTILIVLLGAIGDVVRAFPLAAAIKQNWPDSKITWGVESASFGIVQECRYVSRAVEFKRKEGLKGYFAFISALREEEYELTIDLQRHFKSGLTSFLSGSPVRVGFNKKNSREGNCYFNNYQIDEVTYLSDKIDQYLNFSNYFGFEKVAGKLDFGINFDQTEILNLEEKLTTKFSEINEPFYAAEKRALLFIGSTWESKIWPSIHFVELAKKIYSELKLIPILVGAGNEKFKAEEIMRKVSVPVVNLVGQTTLKEFKNLCFNAKFAVASDSGPMHIASAVGLPVFSVWGPTSPIRSKPYGNESRIIQSPIGCRECYQRRCPGLSGICLSDISAEVVFSMIESQST